MKQQLSLALLAFSLLLNPASPLQNPARGLEQPRRDLGGFFDKLRTTKAVTVAWLGGSTAAGLGASEIEKTSYRALVSQWLRARYPQTKIIELNATVAGTGSVYGSMRVRRDVIAHKPDLVFIDFAFEDSEERESDVKKAIEGTVRQLLLVPQPPEIVFLNAAKATRGPAPDRFETIAAYYRLPSIDLHHLAWSMVDSGRATAASLWKSEGALLDEGHRLAAGFITDFLASQEKYKTPPMPKMLPPPLISDELTYGELTPFAQLKRGPVWRTEPVSDRNLPATLLLGDKPGLTFETTFEGSIVGIAYRTGPDGGTIECLIDGAQAPAPMNVIDTYHPSPRIQTRIIAGGLTPGEHRLTIRILPEKNAKSTGHHLRLGYFIAGGQRPERL
jgi:hypothetical protein